MVVSASAGKVAPCFECQGSGLCVDGGHLMTTVDSRKRPIVGDDMSGETPFADFRMKNKPLAKTLDT